MWGNDITLVGTRMYLDVKFSHHKLEWILFHITFFYVKLYCIKKLHMSFIYNITQNQISETLLKFVNFYEREMDFFFT